MCDNYGYPVSKIATEDLDKLLEKDPPPTVVYFETGYVPKMGTLTSVPLVDEDFDSGECVEVRTNNGDLVTKDSGTVFLGGINDFVEVWFKPEYARRAAAADKAQQELQKRKVKLEEFQEMGKEVTALLVSLEKLKTE